MALLLYLLMIYGVTDLLTTIAGKSPSGYWHSDHVSYHNIIKPVRESRWTGYKKTKTRAKEGERKWVN